MTKSKIFLDLAQELPALNEEAEGLLKGGRGWSLPFGLGDILCDHSNQKNCDNCAENCKTNSMICLGAASTTATATSTSTPTPTSWYA